MAQIYTFWDLSHFYYENYDFEKFTKSAILDKEFKSDFFAQGKIYQQFRSVLYYCYG